MPIELLVDRENFPACRKSTYLNAASIAPMHRGAAEAVLAWQRDLARNGTLNFDERAEEDIFDDLHLAAARLFHADPADIAVGSSATELLSSLAWALVPDEKAVIIGTQAAHPSTIYPWQRIARHAGAETRLAEADEKGLVGASRLMELIDARTALVCVSHVEYRTGQLYDLRALASKAHRYGALLIVDATQSAGQAPIAVREMKVDALVSSGYKWLCGPFGAAVMYLAPELQSRLDPGLVGWRSHKDMWDFRADRLEYPEEARRFEASTMAYGCAIGLAKSIHLLNEIGVERISAHNKYLAGELGTALREMGAEILSPERDSERSSIISVSFPGRNTAEIARRLGAAQVVVSYRSGAIRFSPHLYNDLSDIERAIQVTEEALGI